MNDLNKRLDQVERAAQAQGVDGVLLAQIAAQWDSLTEAEREKLRSVAQREGLPVLIIDR